ncbi:Orf89 [Heliothis zea nudivirus]|uniref:31k virion structural protein n=2 Tax=Betanudivirus hezeae TaxID=3052000 RepID=G9I078_HZNV2|nr:Orf89 [Heliothis zea nudivirus]YP_004956800.1 orf52 gene product [Helicoverpa zea nudivirus 2]AAN04383.1 Orf89 [Heliothis zea nudivirus]AEW69601.1 31k virion structural protein [Helicoverpa zea nudivirus 2]WCZ68532.1 31k virion structural protein [Heliothis virescens nudivirus]
MFCSTSSQSGAQRCIFQNVYVRCTLPVAGIICNPHLNLLFSMSLVKNRVVINNVAKTKVYMAPTPNLRGDNKLIPFPYSVSEGRVCRSPSIENIISEMQAWVSRLDVDQASACHLTQILTVMFTENLIASQDMSRNSDNMYLNQYRDYMQYIHKYDKSLNSRFANTRIFAYSRNGSIEMSMTLMPQIIKILLFNCEASTNYIPEATSFPPNLYLDLDARAFKLINHDIVANPIAYYDVNRDTDVASPLVFAGDARDDVNVLFSRNLVNFRVSEVGIALCSS